jgi:glycerate 2-kinase
MQSVRALASPASLKGSLSAVEAAAALAEGFRSAGAEADGLPVADGGEGTMEVLHAALGGRWWGADAHDAFGRPRAVRWLELPDGTAVVEAAEAVPLDPDRLDVAAASSRGVGELIQTVGRPRALVVGLGGTANMDAGEGLLSVLRELPAPTRVACDVRTVLVDAPRLYGPQKGASADLIRELEARFAGHPFGHIPGSGAAGGLGAALASLGAELVPGAELVLGLIGFDPRGYDLVVTGEGTVDATTWEGKAPSAVAGACAEHGVRCVVFGGRVLEGDAVSLSGDPQSARGDLVELGRNLVSGSRR